MVQIPPRRAHWLRAIILASPIKKLRPQPTERTPTAWHTNEEYINAEASEEASASSAVANVSENRVLPIATPPISDTNPAFITVFLSVVLTTRVAIKRLVDETCDRLARTEIGYEVVRSQSGRSRGKALAG